MKEYNTSEIAKEFNIHPNTVRFYEDIEFLPQIPRKENGYRTYNQIHFEQLKLIRIGLKSELLQNGLRKQVIDIIKASAKGEYDEALELARKHLESISKEEKNAEEAIKIVENNLLKESVENSKTYTRKQLADYLELTIDTLRNWELNGLLRIKRKENGYRVYNEDDIKRIKIIRSLRCVNFSLSAILRLLGNLDNNNNNVDIKHIIDTPKENEDIVSVCDKLLTSLENAEDECNKMIIQIKKMKKINPPV
jgi:DNA-binding transcriptional MerR regulator